MQIPCLQNTAISELFFQQKCIFSLVSNIAMCKNKKRLHGTTYKKHKWEKKQLKIKRKAEILNWIIMPPV